MPTGEREKTGVLLAYDVMMREQVAPALRELGFTGTLRQFTIRRDGAHGTVAWQKDARAYRMQLLLFTANISYWCGSSRIAHLMPEPVRDTWWQLTGGEPAGPVAQAVITAVRCFALPAILAGLEDPAPHPHDRASDLGSSGPGREPDGGGADPAAWYVQPVGTQHDHRFADFTSNDPRARADAARVVALSAGDDPRTVPGLLDRLEHDPDPVIRKTVASRQLTRFGHDRQVRPALHQAAARDEHPGVRWAGRYALRVLQIPDLDAALTTAMAQGWRSSAVLDAKSREGTGRP
jgi:hypothetical protein